ncbi:hypothetical protein FHW84_002776 [Dyella sp. SG562]|uniref:hypothetical protein n=1 Tax=Dyella sp. SG562 TaxID=2587017 RepID=UPI001424788A|nr:hypothetical protein [Dyella sp. SG562]NII74191.1 hypothetical protein [Dyella sp. SG562]
MTLPTKKVFERLMLEGLLERLSIRGSVLDQDLEAPDLVMTLDGKQIGVEVTEIQKSDEERAVRSPKEDILRKARKLYDAGGGRPLSATFSFQHGVDLRRGINRQVLAVQLARFLTDHAPTTPITLSTFVGSELPDELRPWLSAVRFWTTNSPGIWQIAEAGWVAALTPAILQPVVDAKATLLPNYRLRGFDAYWLLICAHPSNPACRFDPCPGFDGAAVRSPFDRTFFYDCWHWLELGRLAGGP